MIKKLFESADMYLKVSDWKDIALIKGCLCSLGVLIGLSIKSGKKIAGLIASIVFVLTYIPIMIKFIGVLKQSFTK